MPRTSLISAKVDATRGAAKDDGQSKNHTQNMKPLTHAGTSHDSVAATACQIGAEDILAGCNDVRLDSQFPARAPAGQRVCEKSASFLIVKLFQFQVGVIAGNSDSDSGALLEQRQPVLGDIWCYSCHSLNAIGIDNGVVSHCPSDSQRSSYHY